MTPTVRLRAAFCGVLLAAAACVDSNPAAAPGPIAAPAESHGALSCAVDVRASTLACRPARPETAAGARTTILGGQGVNVRLASSGTAYDAGAGILRSDVTVENLASQMLGTADGLLPDPAGVRVFFASGPTVTAGTGSVTVESADGTETFTQGGQSYIRYPGILAPGDTTAPKEWRFAVPSTVVSFAFTVYVAAPVLREEGWVSLTPVAPSMRVGQSLRLNAVVRSVTGEPVAGAKVTWTVSSDGIRATVDSTGRVTAHEVLFGQDGVILDVTATSGGRRGVVRVYVSAAGGDHDAPSIAAVDVSPTLVDNDGVDSVTVSVAVSEPRGMESVQVEFEPFITGQEPRRCTSGAPASGTRTAGVFSCRIGFPAGSPGGVWQLRLVTARGYESIRQLTHLELDAAGVRSTIYVRGPLFDYILPALTSFTFSPDSVGVVTDTLTIDVGAADADSGVAEVMTVFSDGAGGPSQGCNTRVLRSGTRHDGVFRCRMLVPAFIRSERLEARVLIKDGNGNLAEVTRDELASRGFPWQLKVQPDTTVPVITAFSFPPDTVAADGVEAVSVTATARDAPAGVREMEVQFRRVSDSLPQRCIANTPPATSRTFQCDLHFPYGYAGAWRLDYLRVSDSAGHVASLDAAQAQAAGYRTELTVRP